MESAKLLVNELENKAVEDVKKEVEKKDDGSIGEQGEVATESKLGEMEKSDSEADYDSDHEYESASEGESDRGKSDKENEMDESDEHAELVHWRINFRNRNQVPSDQIIVDSITPTEETSADPFSEFGIGQFGEILAGNFQFRHELKNSTYKNKYVLVLDSYKMRFSERDDSVLIRSATDATVHMGMNNTLVRRNMAMEELRKVVGMNLRVWKSLFTSNRSCQMGEMDLTKYENTIAAECLSIVMDSCQNVIQIIKLHKPELLKLTLICCDPFSEILELEQVRKCPNLKLEGSSNITDEQLLTVAATNFEITSAMITGKGINAFLKARLAEDISDEFYARLQCRGQWIKEDALEGLEYTEYDTTTDYTKKNGSIPMNVYEYTLVHLPTNKPDERLAVIINKYYFECFKEAKKPAPLCHDLTEIN